MFDFSAYPIITTERLRLREITHADADAIMAIYGSPDVLRYLNQKPIDTREKAITDIDRLHGYYLRQDAVPLGITLKEGGSLIGTITPWNWDRENRHVDLGYVVHPAEWGHGYATEAVRAILGWAFDAMEVHRIQAECTSDNLASEHVLLKCGFMQEGLLRECSWEDSRWVSIKQFGLLRREWNTAHH